MDKFPVPGQSSEFVACVTKFEEFYKAEYGGSKKLRWLYNHGTVMLATSEGKTKREVVVTPLQASILLLFNQKESWSLAEIRAALFPGEQASYVFLSAMKFCLAQLMSCLLLPGRSYDFRATLLPCMNSTSVRCSKQPSNR